MNRDILRKCQFPLILALGTLPMVLLLFSLTAIELLPFAWIFPAAYAVLVVLSLAIRGKWRLLFGVAGVILMAAPCPMLLSGKTCLVALFTSGFYGVLLLWCLRFAGWDKSEELSAAWIGTCLAMQLIGQAFWFVESYQGVSVFEPVAHWFPISFFLFVMLSMLSRNRASLAAVTGNRQGISIVMRHKNRMLTLALFAIALLFSLIPSMFEALKSIAVWLSEVLDKLYDLLNPPSQIVPPTGPAETEPTLGPMQSTEVSSLADLLNNIAYIFCVVVSIPVLLFWLYKLAKLIVNHLHRLWAALMRQAASTTEDYEDEIADTRDHGTVERISPRKRRRLAADERGMTPGGRIRYRYLRLSMKHPEWKPGSTARENLPEQAATLYERARYSNHPMTEEETARFKAETKRM